MKIKRAAKHLILIILTLLVLIIMLFVPELFLSYTDKNSKAVITEKNSPVILELKSDISLPQKAYIAINGSKEITLTASHTRTEVEDKVLSICKELLYFPDYEGDVEGDLDDIGYDSIGLDNSLNIEIKNILSTNCTSIYTDEHCVIWYVVANIEGNILTMVLDDETLALLNFSFQTPNYPRGYIGSDLMDLMSTLFNLIHEEYNVMQINFIDSLHQEYIESDTGFTRSVAMTYDIVVYEDDTHYTFNFTIDVSGMEFSIM